MRKVIFSWEFIFKRYKSHLAGELHVKTKSGYEICKQWLISFHNPR